MAEILKNEIRLPEIVGKGYREFWNCRKRYRVVKGSRASKKSTTTALNLICRLMEYPAANVLVIRKTAATLKDSCFAQLQWAINRLQVSKYWKSRVNPLELEYIPTGQRIIFRGCDDPLKITSITVPKGHLCWSWIEEAFELSEEEFNRIDESLRGKLPPELFIQLTVTFNPWSSTSFLKAKFFDIPRQNVFAMTTTYECNEFRGNEENRSGQISRGWVWKLGNSDGTIFQGVHRVATRDKAVQNTRHMDKISRDGLGTSKAVLRVVVCS